MLLHRIIVDELVWGDRKLDAPDLPISERLLVHFIDRPDIRVF
jgi:hypothetical protein